MKILLILSYFVELTLLGTGLYCLFQSYKEPSHKSIYTIIVQRNYAQSAAAAILFAGFIVVIRNFIVNHF